MSKSKCDKCKNKCKQKYPIVVDVCHDFVAKDKAEKK